jgi:hypothetical protein
MSSTTDNVLPSTKPNAWRIDTPPIAGIMLGLGNLLLPAVPAMGNSACSRDGL